MLYSPTDQFSGNGVFCTVSELFYEGQRSKGANLHLRRKASALRSGTRRSSIRGRGMEFFESRPYVPLDEMRSIDWKVSARFNGLFTKIFIEEQSRPIYVAVDLRSSMFFGSVNCFKSVLAARLASRLATAAINGGDYIGGLIFDDHHEHECALGTGRKNLARLFGLLAHASKSVAREPSDSSLLWPSVLKRITNRIHAGAAVFLISDFSGLGEEQHHLLFNMRKKADVFALSIGDPLEERLPSLGTVGMAFGNVEIVFDSNNLSLAKKYHAWFNEQKSKLAALFASLNIPLMSFSTADDLDASIRRIFSGRF